jgi:hypothetical protein
MDEQKLYGIEVILRPRCVECKYVKKLKAHDWRCTFNDFFEETHPLFPACEYFEPKRDDHEKSCIC